MKIYHTILFIFLFITALSSKGQGVSISPCVHFGDEIPAIREYNEKLERLLSEGLNADYIVRFIAKPSIEPEYVFQIDEIDSSEFEISTLTLRSNLWNTKNVDSIFCKKREIKEDLVIEISTLFKILIGSVSAKNAYGVGEGGITYNFFYSSEGTIRCGEVATHSKNSLLNEVIQVCDNLMQYAQGEDIKLRDLCHKVKFIIKQIE